MGKSFFRLYSSTVTYSPNSTVYSYTVPCASPAQKIEYDPSCTGLHCPEDILCRYVDSAAVLPQVR